MTAPLRTHVVLVGAMGAGKSTLGRRLAADLGWPYHDSDHAIVALLGRTGGDVAEHEGVEVLHRIEELVLLADLAPTAPSVISAAASTVDSIRCRRALAERAHVVWLDIPVDLALERARQGTHRRVVTDDDIARLHARRAPLFAEVSDRRIDATAEVGSVAGELVHWVMSQTSDV